MVLFAPINKIINHTMVDGPGNRTAVFFQKCNMTCKYCHNPETQNLCNHCQICVEGCPVEALSVVDNKVVWNQDLCIACDACIKVCPHFSSPKINYMSAQQVFEQICENLPFIRGITVSGGESTIYSPFLEELFSLCKEVGLTCLIDTNGAIPLWDTKLLELCDGVMLDVKAWSSLYSLVLTGISNEIVKENLRQLSRAKKLEELRIVCLEGHVDSEVIIEGISNNVTEQTKKEVTLKLIRFRNHGVKGELSNTAAPSMAYMENLTKLAESHGFAKIRVV